MSLVIWLAATALGGGFEVAAQDAEAAGLAHAGTALPARPGSAWFNPAALTDGGGFRGSVGAALARSSVTASAPDGAWSTRSVTPLGVPPYLHLAYSRADWAVAVTANVPFGGGIVWPDGWEGRHEALASRPQFFRVGGSFAYRLGIVRLGAGVHVDVGSLSTRRATDHVTEDGEVAVALRGRGVGGDGYLLVTPGPHARIGLSYKSRTRLRLAGEADFDVPVVFAADVPDQRVRSRWTLPDRIALGFAWDTEDWLVSADVSVTVWSVNDELVLDFEEPRTTDTVIVNGWRPTAAVRFGAEGGVHPMVTVRGGLEVDGIPGAPASADRLSPSSPDSTRVGVSVGLGIDPIPQFGIHAWVQPLLLLRRESSASFEATYQGYAVLAGLGITFGAPNPSPTPADELPVMEVFTPALRPVEAPIEAPEAPPAEDEAPEAPPAEDEAPEAPPADDESPWDAAPPAP